MRRFSIPMISFFLAIAMLAASAASALACTGITLTAADGSVVRGRTMEFAQPLNSEVILIPRGVEMQGTTGGNESGLTWTTRYAATGASGLGMSIIVDGLNEKGLGGGIFYFPDFAGYQDVPAGEESKVLAPWELLTWVLTNFATVEEVKTGLSDVLVANVEYAEWGIVPPAHYQLTDATGKSIAIEYVAGELHVYDNPLGVFTNAPTFDWHMTNLRNYIGISPNPAEQVTVEGINLDPLSTGGNLFGMPGDFSSPSRFVRAVVFSHLTPQAATGQDAVMAGFHILDNFDIPEGSVPEPKGTNPPFEITEWTTMSDLTALTFFIWTNENRAIRTIDLNEVALDGKEIQFFSLDQPQEFINVGGS